MKKTILSLFILATLGITSCSSDSDGTTTDATNVNLPTTYEPTSGNINTYARTGVNENTTLLDLTGQNSSLKFELLTTENVVELSADGRKIQTKTNLPQNTVGNKTIQYRVVQTGTSFSTANTLSFVIHYGQNEKVSVNIDQLNYSDGGILELNGIYDNMVIQDVPWQYVTLMSSNTNLFQLEIYLESTGNVDTDSFTQYSGESIFGRITNTITSTYVSNIDISVKKRANSDVKVFKLRVRLSNNGTYVFGNNNDCNYNNTLVDYNFIANCETI